MRANYPNVFCDQFYCTKRIYGGASRGIVGVEGTKFPGILGPVEFTCCPEDCRLEGLHRQLLNLEVPDNTAKCSGKKLVDGLPVSCTLPVVGYPDEPGYCSSACFLEHKVTATEDEPAIPACVIVQRHRAWLASDNSKELETMGFQ